jgi:phenylalanine ammonia-lyase
VNVAVNTGIGGSASTRTSNFNSLQVAAIRMLNCGILDDHLSAENSSAAALPSSPTTVVLSSRFNEEFRESSGTEVGNSMPQDWVKAAQLVRSNSLACGHSGVRVELLKSLVQLIEEDLVPRIPLRGSISSSGDLIPLSYIASTLQGNPGIQVWCGKKGERKLLSADLALKSAGMELIEFAPKEAVSLVNGTAVSTGAAALVMHDSHGLIVLAQVLTAMAVESLYGSRESFDAYFSEIRPHRGQTEVAHNVFNFLNGSRFIREADEGFKPDLCQDRYALRTAAQWMGPEIENLQLAHEQVLTECNSITDNPLLNPKDGGKILNGGNFQAMSITSAMDKTRAVLHAMGRMLFQQLTEVMNPPTSNGLPPSLTAEEPSSDFMMKGMDVAAASYQSELAFLSHSVVPFVMVAEQGNQSLNSLALISTRYTNIALDVFMKLCATILVAYCQALDLRTIQHKFLAAFKPDFTETSSVWIERRFNGPEEMFLLQNILWSKFQSEFYNHMTLDSEDRFKTITGLVGRSAYDMARSKGVRDSEFHRNIEDWTDSMSIEAHRIFQQTLDSHDTSDTTLYIGTGSRRMHSFVRVNLNIPFLRVEEPSSIFAPAFKGGKSGDTIGSYISRVYHALKDQTLIVPVMECLKEASSRH